MSWRVHRDPWDEARRLQVAGAISNLEWDDRRLKRELALSEDAKMFIGRVRNAIQKAHQKKADEPVLLRQNLPYYRPQNEEVKPINEEEIESARLEGAFTSNPWQAMFDAGESPPADVVDTMSKVAKARARADLEVERERRQGQPLHQRLAQTQAKAKAKGIDGSARERRIERQVLEYERFVDDRAA